MDVLEDATLQLQAWAASVQTIFIDAVRSGLNKFLCSTAPALPAVHPAACLERRRKYITSLCIFVGLCIGCIVLSKGVTIESCADAIEKCLLLACNIFRKAASPHRATRLSKPRRIPTDEEHASGSDDPPNADDESSQDEDSVHEESIVSDERSSRSCSVGQALPSSAPARGKSILQFGAARLQFGTATGAARRGPTQRPCLYGDDARPHRIEPPQFQELADVPAGDEDAKTSANETVLFAPPSKENLQAAASREMLNDAGRSSREPCEQTVVVVRMQPPPKVGADEQEVTVRSAAPLRLATLAQQHPRPTDAPQDEAPAPSHEDCFSFIGVAAAYGAALDAALASPEDDAPPDAVEPRLTQQEISDYDLP